MFGLPPVVNGFYQQGRRLYLQQMDGVLDRIVNIIAIGLANAKAHIANGRKTIQQYLAGLPQNLRALGQQAATDIQTQFDELEQTVDSKKDLLVDTLADKYKQNLQAIDSRIDQLKAANQGLVNKAFSAMTQVISTINNIKQMLLGVLGRANGVIGNILKDPVKFLGNLITGIKQGFQNFAGNIVTHLESGFVSWLTGTMAPMGIQIPDNVFSLPGVFSLVAQVLGLTYSNIRRKAVKRFGERTVLGMESSVEIFQVLREQGVIGLWEQLQAQFSDLKETVIEEIKNMLVTQVITAGVKWVLSLLNPASAFVRAAMAIYDIVMFFVNRGSQVLELVNAVIDAVAAIASGAVGGAAKLVENALARALPVAIGFFASLLGVGGLANRVERIIGRVRHRIDRAIDRILLKASRLFKGNKGKNKDKSKDENKKKEAHERLHKTDREIELALAKGKPEKQARVVIQRIARDNKVKANLTRSGEGWKLKLKVNPELERFFEGEDLKAVKKLLNDANKHTRDAAQVMSDRRNELKATGLNRPQAKAKWEEEVQAAGGAVAYVQKLIDKGKIKDRASGSGAVVGYTQRQDVINDNLENKYKDPYAGVVHVPGGKGAGFDAVLININEHKAEVFEIKKGGLIGMGVRSTSKVPKTKIPVPFDPKEGKGSEALRHLDKPQTQQEKDRRADELVSGGVLVKTNKKNEQRIFENKISAISENLRTNLEATVTNLKAKKKELKGSAIEQDGSNSFKVLENNIDNAITIIESIITGTAGKLELIIAIEPGASTSRDQLEVIDRLLNAGIRRLHTEQKEQQTNINYAVKEMDEQGNIIKTRS